MSVTPLFTIEQFRAAHQSFAPTSPEVTAFVDKYLNGEWDFESDDVAVHLYVVDDYPGLIVETNGVFEWAWVHPQTQSEATLALAEQRLFDFIAECWS
jgi:hypothetical protein